MKTNADRSGWHHDHATATRGEFVDISTIDANEYMTVKYREIGGYMLRENIRPEAPNLRPSLAALMPEAREAAPVAAEQAEAESEARWEAALQEISKREAKWESGLAKLEIGATKKDFLYTLGLPWDINPTVSGHGIRVQWIYKKPGNERASLYLYFEDGELVSWQD